MHSFWIYPTQENTASPDLQNPLVLLPGCHSKETSWLLPSRVKNVKGTSRARCYLDHMPLPGTAPTVALIGFSIHGVEILGAGGVQTDPVFAPLPTPVNLFLSRWSCSVEPEIWKNLTRSGFGYRKTLFKVNTGIPPSSRRNVEPAGSELSSFSEKPLLKPVCAMHWAPLTEGGACLEPGALAIASHSPPAKASSAPDLEKQTALVRGEGLRMPWDFPLPLLPRAVKESLFLEKKGGSVGTKEPVSCPPVCVLPGQDRVTDMLFPLPAP